MNFTRIFEVLEFQAARFPLEEALVVQEAGQWRSWSSSALLRERERLSAGLLERGLHKGDRVGVLVHSGSPKWVIADGALLQCGMVPVPIHATARADEIAFIAKDAGLKACFVSNADMLARIAPAGLSAEQLISFEPFTGATAWEDVACDPSEHELGKIEYLRGGIQPEDLALLLYTSGTTGQPRGVMLSHANLVSNVKAVLAIAPIGPQMRALSFLPLSHVFERMVLLVYQASGASVWFAQANDQLADAFREVRPHFFAAVPRILERIYDRLWEERQSGGRLKKIIMDWAIGLGEKFPYTGVHDMPPLYRIKRWVADLLVYRSWRKRMGGRVRYVVVGAAAMAPRLGRLFSAAGVDVREGYGLTETSPVVAFNRFEPGGVHFGTVGIAAPGVEIRIAAPEGDAPDGEVEVRGPNVMLGYWNAPEATAEKFTPDGWLRTGDLGRIEHKRFLRITGRKSELFKTSSGKFVAPSYVEQQLLRSPFIAQALVTGANEAGVSALIVPNFPHLEIWCRDNKVHWTAPQYMVLNPKVQKLMQQEVDHVNDTRLGAVERIRRFELLHEAWTTENGMLTPTMKLRRGEILKNRNPS